MRAKSETLVAVNPGDHPFIKHRSVVGYRYARIERVDVLDNLLESGVAKMREPASEALLKRIRAGLLDSDFTRNDVKEYFKSLQKHMGSA